MKEIIKANVRREVKETLLYKKRVTGRSISELVEFAILNIPYIPPKNKQGNKSLIREEDE